jgi:hypothetical protein
VTLADLRKLAIRRQTRIRFPLRNGMECVITEHGIAEVPALKGVPDFNLEEELVSVTGFLLDPIPSGKKNQPLKPVSIPREELAGMAVSSAPEASAHEDD